MTGYMPAELMYGQNPIMLIEKIITSWIAIPWENEMTREELLGARIRQLERRPEDLEQARKLMEVARVKNKIQFDKTHRLRPKKIEEGDWVLFYESSLDNQHKTTRKFARRWFGPYVVTSANDNATYHLAELDGPRLAVPIASKRVKIFKKRQDKNLDLDDLDDEKSGAEPTNVSNDNEEEEETDLSP